ncbi:MAG: hypothetical protein ACKV2Q_28655 [Planctomycetaceae bacterium]
MRWCLYALGGGLGHLTRGLALARAAIARGHDVTVLSNSSDAARVPAVTELGLARRLITIPSEFDHQQVSQLVQERLTASSFDVLVVDTFPRGLAGELHDLLATLSGKGIKTVLVHRDLQPRYVEWAKLGSLAHAYDLILSPGESGPLANLPNARRTDAWLIRDPHELLDQHAAWQRLRIVETDRPVIAVIASGLSAERPAMSALASRLSRALHGRASVRLMALGATDAPDGVETVALWPCLSAMAGIDLLIGAGGYNTVSEAHATRTPLLAIARRRLYDRQELRLPAHERVADEVEAEQKAIQWIAQSASIHREPVPQYTNGVHDAVGWIESLG